MTDQETSILENIKGEGLHTLHANIFEIIRQRDALAEALHACRPWLQVDCAIRPEITVKTHGPSDALRMLTEALATLS